MAIDIASAVNHTTIKNPFTETVTAGRTEQPVNQQKETGTSSVADTVSISNTTKKLQSLENTVAQLPVVDSKKVEDIRNQITNGTFKINQQHVAEKLIGLESSLFSEF